MPNRKILPLLIILLLETAWMATADSAWAQNPVYVPGGWYNSPPVSPYLNLGVTQTGLSNYQTLVRPMIDDREAILRQDANLQKLQQQLRVAPNGRSANLPRGKETQPPATSTGVSKHFMHYSHYFGGSN
jgi:hypothetical protein